MFEVLGLDILIGKFVTQGITQIRLVLERLLNHTEYSNIKQFAEKSVLAYSSLTLLDKIFDSESDSISTPAPPTQRQLYFPIPDVPDISMARFSAPRAMVSAGAVRGPVEFLTLPRERRLIEPNSYEDVTYADVDEYQQESDASRDNTFDVISTSSAEFEDLSSSEELSDLERHDSCREVECTNISRTRRTSSLNDLVSFRKQFLAEPGVLLERPKSVAIQSVCDANKERLCRTVSDDSLNKKSTSSLKRVGSVLRSSFRKIRSKPKDEIIYESLNSRSQDSTDRSKIRSIFKSKGSTKTSPKSPRPVPISDLLLELSLSKGMDDGDNISPPYHTTRATSLRPKWTPLSTETEYLLDNLWLEYQEEVRISNINQNSCSPGILLSQNSRISAQSIVSEYQDYEIPTELLLAVEQQQRILKSKSAYELGTISSPGNTLRKSISLVSHGCNSIDSNRHSPEESSIGVGRRKLKIKRRSTRSVLFGTFSKKASPSKSISDILGSPPPLPTQRRPSLLCDCCNTHHIINQSLPGMSITPMPNRACRDTKIRSKDKLEGLDSGFYDNVSLTEVGKKKNSIDYEVLTVGSEPEV